jgi:hypothetical protein
MTFLSEAAAGPEVAIATEGVLGRILKRFGGSMRWRPASTAPFNCDIQLYMSGNRGSVTTPFPCRQTRSGWINSELNVRLDIEPTEWRVWPTGKFGAVSPGRTSSLARRTRVPALIPAGNGVSGNAIPGTQAL